MLQSCWDCLAGDGARTEEPYSVQLNRNNLENNFSAPPWPTPEMQNEKMFILPKILDPQDKITVNCTTASDPGLLIIGLVTGYNKPDYENLACQLEMYLPPANSDMLVVKTKVNGETNLVHKDSARDNFEGSPFSMTFRMRDNGWMDLNLGDTNLHTMKLVHDVETIKFLTVSGDFDKVLGIDFQFG